MVASSLSRARDRARALRADAARARQRRSGRNGRAADALTDLTVDDLGQLVAVEFAAEVVETGPDRWATSLLGVYRAACTDAGGSAGTAAAPASAPWPADGSGPPVRPEPAMPGHPLAPEQHRTRELTDRMADRFADFTARQGGLQLTGSSDEVSLSFDGALKLTGARATPAALRRGPAALAAAVTAAWQDARHQLTDRMGLPTEPGGPR